MVNRLSVIANPVVSLCIYSIYIFYVRASIYMYVCMYVNVYLCMHVCLFGSLVLHITAAIGLAAEIKSE